MDSDLGEASIPRKRTRAQEKRYWFEMHKNMGKLRQNDNLPQSEESIAHRDQSSTARRVQSCISKRRRPLVERVEISETDEGSSGSEGSNVEKGSDSDVEVIGETVASNGSGTASALNRGSGSGSWSNVGSVREASPKRNSADEVVSSTSSMNGSAAAPIELQESGDTDMLEDSGDSAEEFSDTTDSSEMESEASSDEDNDDPDDKDYRVNVGKKKGRAYPLRPRSVHKPSKKKQRPVNSSGVIILSDAEESESSSEGDITPDNSVQNGARKNRIKTQKKTSTSEKEIESDNPVQTDAPKARRKTWKKSIPANLDFVKAVVDSIVNADDKFVSPGEKDQVPVKKALPLKFRFEDEDPVPREKEEWEKEIDNLFAEMELGFLESNIGFTNTSLGESESESENVLTACQKCQKGNHDLILDEQIGQICKICSCVYQEIKYIFPSFADRTSGRYERKYYGESSSFLDVDGFKFGDSSANHDTAYDVEGTVWDLIPRNAKGTMYPHQRDGFEFMWKQIAGDISLEKLKQPLSPTRGGCIISHLPGTGKTRLTLVFLQAFLKQFPECRPMIITPPKLLATWEAEFQKWEVRIPFHNLNNKDFSGHEDLDTLDLYKRVYRCDRHSLSDRQKRHYKRLVKLKSWTKDASILGISYPLFDKLTRENENGCAKEIREILLKYPGLVVLEEGHTPRNEHSHMFKAVTKIETEKRILLSGTPFQNNFKELYNTLSVVSPRFAAGLERKWASVINCIDKNGQALGELKDIIAPLVHVCGENVKNQSLPGIRDTVVHLKPTDSQKELLKSIPENPGKFYHQNLLSLISVHPSLVADKEEFSYLQSHLKDRRFQLDPNAGVKMKFVIELIRLCNGMSERVIIFSQLLDPLNLIKEQLTSLFHWILGREILYMDGKLDMKQRQTSINSLNDPKSDVKVLLASTRACSEGINLIGASRVVLLDVLWNPSVERQAISRAYRNGQTRFVHVYRLVTVKWEIDKIEQQTRKKHHSDMLLSRDEDNTCKTHPSCSVSEDTILEAMSQHESLGHIFENLTPGMF